MNILASFSTHPVSIDALLESKYPYLLVSYYYLSTLSNRTEIFHKLLQQKKFLMIDSGAHTFQQKVNIDLNNFVKQYGEFLKQYSSYIDAFVELDVDSQVSLTQIEDWRKYLEDTTGKQPIVVWHKPRGINYWYKMIEQYKYVGITGIGMDGEKDIDTKHFSWFVDTAHKSGAKIHGFAFVNLSMLSRIHFDTVDSVSWWMKVVYGYYSIENGFLPKQLNKTKYRMKNNREIEKIRAIRELNILLNTQENINKILQMKGVLYA